jgi:hypothetical protein
MSPESVVARDGTDQQGLRLKYRIFRSDMTPLAPGFEAFVMRLDAGGDPVHVAACRKAVMVYADEIASFLPALAADLRARYGC